MNTTENKLTHFDAEGNAVMVDVSGKPVTSREATAHGIITMNEDAFAAVQNGTLTEARINESVLRILTVKAHFGILTEVPPAAEGGG